MLLPQRKVNPKHPRKLAKRIEVTGSNQLWQMDLKYGYIAGMDYLLTNKSRFSSAPPFSPFYYATHSSASY